MQLLLLVIVDVIFAVDVVAIAAVVFTVDVRTICVRGGESHRSRSILFHSNEFYVCVCVCVCMSMCSGYTELWGPLVLFPSRCTASFHW